MWPPFVRQCIAMVRDHEHNYVRGPGYNQDDHGSVTERCESATAEGLHSQWYIDFTCACKESWKIA